jgi:AcrR family transcriptional regulator
VSTARQPQQDRSRATHQALLDATIESLAEVGWAGTTVVAVAARSGVSRGAAQHHFPTRDELVQAAVDRVIDSLTESLAVSRVDVAARDDRTLAALEVLTELWSSAAGRAATHLWIAASTDPTLKELVLPLERRFNRALYKATIDLLGADVEQPRVREAVRLTLDLTRGIGIGSLVRRDRSRLHADLAQWAAMLAAIPGASGGHGV